MPTTALLVELVIVGITFFISAIPIVTLIFNATPQSIITFYLNIPITFQLALAYPFGIVWNRICDQIFSKIDDRIIVSKFSSKTSFQTARIEVVMQGESIRDYIGNFRSLIRINRALSIMMLAYCIFTPIYFVINKTDFGLNTRDQIAICVIELIVLLTSVYSWFRLEKGYISAIEDAIAIVKKRDNKNLKKGKGEKNG